MGIPRDSCAGPPNGYIVEHILVNTFALLNVLFVPRLLKSFVNDGASQTRFKKGGPFPHPHNVFHREYPSGKRASEMNVEGATTLLPSPPDKEVSLQG